MAKEAASRGRWRDVQPSKTTSAQTKRKKWSSVTISSLLLLIVGGGTIAVLAYLFFRPSPRPYFAPFWVSNYQKPWIPTVPWMEADRKAMRDGAFFSGLDSIGFSNPTQEVMRDGLRALRNRKVSESVVVYLASYALVDDEGAVQILGTDSDPDVATTLLSLNDVLRSLADCRSRHKLLVLDITRPLSLPGPSGLGDNVADHIANEVAAVKDDHRLVLVSCARGQRSLGSETLGESAFNHFFRLGLAGAAETSRDKIVDVKELAQYLKQAVDEWTVHNLGLHQQPDLLGSGPGFELIAVTERKAAPALPAAPVLAEKEKEKTTAKDQEKEKEAAKTKGAEPPSGSGYPKWLADGWEEHDRWWESSDLLSAPRAFRMLEAAILEAEHDWRGGGDPVEIKRLFDRRLREIRVERDRSRPTPPQPFHSVGQALAYGGWRSQPDLVAALKALVKMKKRPDSLLPPQKQAENLTAAVNEFRGKFKDKDNPGLDLAGTIVAATEDDQPDAQTVTFLSQLVNDAGFGAELVETRFLRSLSSRLAKEPPPVDSREKSERDEAIRQAWTVVTLAERANNQPYALAWVRKVLDEAEARRHLGEVLLRPEAAGFVSWEKIDGVWKEALEGDGYMLVNGTQETIRAAQITARRMMDVLPAYVPYLESGVRPDLEDVWLKSVKTTREILTMLQTPEPGPDGGSVLSAELLRSRNNERRAATEALGNLLNDLLRPFRGEAVLGLLKQCESDKADPQVVREIDAALTTPFLSRVDREKLWASGRSLARRLASLPFKPEEGTAALATYGNSPETMLPRAVRLAALLAIAGQDVSKLQQKLDSLDTLSSDARAKEWSELVRQFRIGWTGILKRLKQINSKEDEDRPGSIAPIVAINWQANPIRQRLEREMLANRAWLLEHYQHESRDRSDPNDQFYAKAALDSAPATAQPPETYAEFRPAGLETTAVLTAEKSSISRTLQVVLNASGDESAQDVELNVISPGDNRLSINPPSRVLKLTPEKPATVSFQVVWNESDRSTRRKPAGFYVQVRLKNQRNYLTRVPLDIRLSNEQLQLVLSNDPKNATALPFDNLLLRTLKKRQLFYLYVNNPSAELRDVRVEILQGTPPAVVESIKLKAKERYPTRVLITGDSAAKSEERTGTKGQAPADPATKAEPLLPELTGPLLMRIVDEKTQQVLDEKRLRVAIASASSLVHVIKTQYVPKHDGEPNQLSVTLRADPALTGPSCPVELVLSEKYMPSMSGPPTDARLVGELSPGSTLELYAKGIPIRPELAGEKGNFLLNIDGRKRALWYRTSFPLEGGGTQTPIEDPTPHIRFKAQPVIESQKPSHLDITFEVDNPPSNASLEFRMIRSDGGNDDIPIWRPTAKKQHLGFAIQKADGALEFEASLDDWTRTIETSNIRGARVLRARLLDAPYPRGKQIDAFEEPIVFDDQPPREIQFGLLPVTIPKGTPAIRVQASATAPISGIKKVEFFVGKEADYATAAKTPGHSVNDAWEAVLDTSKATTDPIIITVRFESGKGVAAFKMAEIGLAVPLPTPPSGVAGAPAGNGLGSIKGKVKQNDLPQPDRIVLLYLFTPAKKYEKTKLQAKTGPGGTYQFKDLKPGVYAVASSNEALGTKGTTEVTVEAGDPTSADIDLKK